MLNGIALFRQFCDAVWEYRPDTNLVYIYHDTITPELCGSWRPYTDIFTLYRDKYICREDLAVWQVYLSPEALYSFAYGERESQHFFLRFDHGNGVEYHEAYLEKKGDSGVLIGSRDIRAEQRNATIAQAVLPEFDYVCRIDVAAGSFVRYYSDASLTALPQRASENYEESFAAFNRVDVVPEEYEALTANMRIDHVVRMLETRPEYILYATVYEGDGLAYKKLRFCYADETRRELLLTRTDVSDAFRERLGRELEEKKRLAYLASMPVAFCSLRVVLGDGGEPEDLIFTYCNAAYEALAGAAPGSLTGRSYYEYFPDGDKKWLPQFYATAFEGTPRVMREYSREFGRELLIHTFRTEPGHCECTVQDVTKETELTNALHRSQAEMRRVLETTTDLMFQFDPVRGQLHISKATGAGQWDLPAAELLSGAAEAGYLEPSSVPSLEAMLRRACEGEHHISGLLRGRVDPCGSWAWYRATLFDYQDEFSHDRRVLGYLKNIDAEMQQQALLRQEAQTDPLTGLLNVGEGQRRILHTLSGLPERHPEQSALFLLDVDNFKQVNDRHGHMTGDRTLRALAQVLRDTFRAQDVIYRLGGDEFAVFVADLVDPEAAVRQIMQRLHDHIEKARAEFPFLSVSVGVYVSNEPCSYEEFYSEADRALYRTKENGKNSYTLLIADESEPS